VKKKKRDREERIEKRSRFFFSSLLFSFFRFSRKLFLPAIEKKEELLPFLPFLSTNSLLSPPRLHPLHPGLEPSISATRGASRRPVTRDDQRVSKRERQVKLDR